MRIPRPIDSSESHALESAMDDLRREWGFHRKFRFRDFLQQWERFVGEVAGGYDLSFDDFTQALEMRDAIDNFAACLPARLSEDLVSALAPLDKAFISATQVVPEPILPSPDEARPTDRWFRVPCRVAPADDQVGRTWLDYADITVIEWRGC
jgi:hypothetical protein